MKKFGLGLLWMLLVTTAFAVLFIWPQFAEKAGGAIR